MIPYLTEIDIKIMQDFKRVLKQLFYEHEETLKIFPITLGSIRHTKRN